MVWPPRHVSAKKEAKDKGDAHSRHFPSARKAFIKSFDIFLYFFFFSPLCTWDTPLAARLAWSLSDLGPQLARYKDIIRHAVLGQKSKKEKKKGAATTEYLWDAVWPRHPARRHELSRRRTQLKRRPWLGNKSGLRGKNDALRFSMWFFYSFPISTLKFILSVFVPAECNLVKVSGSRALISKDDICLTHRKREWERNQPDAGRTNELLIWQLLPGEFTCAVNRRKMKRFNSKIHLLLCVCVRHVPSYELGCFHSQHSELLAPSGVIFRQKSER